MELYRYSALDNKGKVCKGTIKGDTAKMVRNQLRTQGLLPTEVELLDSSQKQQSSKIDKRIGLNHLSVFTRELGALLKAGLELEQSLYATALNCEDKKLQQILLAIHTKILEGYSFSNGLARFPKAFPHVYRASVGAGEQAGFVGDVLVNLADYLEAQQIMRQNILTILMYPIILSFVAIAIIAFLLIYVAPKILAIFEQTQSSLPMITQILMVSSEFLAAYGLWLVLAVGVGFWLIKWALTKKKIRAQFHHVLLKIPLLGNLIALIQTGRFLRTLSILTRARVSILQSFAVSSELVTIDPIREKLIKAATQIKEGDSIFKALKRTEVFKATTLQLIASGESTGELESMLLYAATNQERQIQFTMDTFLALFEPLLILVMGCLVLFIVLAMLLPMFQISTMV